MIYEVDRQIRISEVQIETYQVEASSAEEALEIYATQGVLIRTSSDGGSPEYFVEDVTVYGME